jgi:hypothetical protein
MKLVIDIDKNVYSMILKGDLYMPLGVLSAFQTAIPLDKIKAEIVLQTIEKYAGKGK